MYDSLILVVEDDADHRELLQVVVEELVGAHPCSAATLAEARSLLESQPIQLVVTDLNLGRENGRDLVATMRSLPAYQQTPIMVLSAAPVKDEAAIRALGATQWFAKPFDVDELAAAISALLAPARLPETERLEWQNVPSS